jgi:chemotaxis protein CheX
MTTMAPGATATYVNPVISATKTVFETMLNCTPRRTGLALKENLSPPHEVSAVIGVTGKAAGTIVLSLSRQTAFEVLNRLVGVQAKEVNSEVCDAVGELTNMIAGAAKAQMAQLALSISIPNIISGPNHVVHYPSNVTPISIVFDSDLGPFAIEVGFAGLG